MNGRVRREAPGTGVLSPHGIYKEDAMIGERSVHAHVGEEEVRDIGEICMKGVVGDARAMVSLEWLARSGDWGAHSVRDPQPGRRMARRSSLP